MRNLLLQRHSLTLILAVSFFLGSCDDYSGKRVHGSGNSRSEDRPVSSFKDIELGGAAKVFLSQGDKSSVRLEGDDNLLQYYTVRQEGDRVIIKEKQGYHLVANNDLRIYITSPTYREIDASGACDIVGETKITSTEGLDVEFSGAGNIKMEVNAPSVKAQCSGTGSMELKGQSRDVDLGISGVGSAHCYELLSENTSVDISGAGSAEVYASVKLDATVSGVGSIKYKGNAPTVNKQVSGAGSVHQAD